MQAFRSVHPQKNIGDVLSAAADGPVVLLNRGQPRAVVMSAAEFRRLKQAAGEAVPAAAVPKAARVIRGGRQDDKLGDDTGDCWPCVRAMAEDAEAPDKTAAIEAEAGRGLAALLDAGLLAGTRPSPSSRASSSPTRPHSPCFHCWDERASTCCRQLAPRW